MHCYHGFIHSYYGVIHGYYDVRWLSKGQGNCHLSQLFKCNSLMLGFKTCDGYIACSHRHRY